MRLSAIVFALAALPSLAAHAGEPDGRAVFQQQCMVCHQANGQGLAGQFPPLAQNRDIFLSTDFPARVVLFGMTGKISVNGKDIDSTMPPLGDVLKDREIVAVVGYVSGAWGNAALRPKSVPPLDAGTVAALRKLTDADNVYAYRERLKAAAAKH